MRRNIIAILCTIAVTAALFAGCGGSSSPSSAAPEASSKSEAAATASAAGEAKDSVTIALWAEPTSLCGMYSPNSEAQFVSRQILEPLVLSDETGTEFKPLLASEWEMNDESTEVLFTLRDDVTFSNGDKMTADDVEFSYNENIRIGIEESVLAYFDHMEKVDDTHVKLVLTQPYADIMKCVACSDCGIVDKKVYEQDPDAYQRNPIGTGPYMLKEWVSGDSINLVANDSYYGEAPSIKNVKLKIFADNSAASLALQNGEIDVCLNPPAIDKDRISGTDGLTWDQGIGLNNGWIYFGYQEDSPFNDENVRLAVAYAIDKDAATLGATEGLGFPSHSCVYGEQWGYTHEGYLAPQNDLAKAKEYMAKSAYPDGFSMDVVTTNLPSYYKIWEVVQPMLSEIGIELNISKVDPSTWNSDVFWPGNYQLNGWLVDMSFPDFDDHVVCWKTGSFLNAAGMSDPYIDEMIEKQDVATSQEERLELIRTLNEYMTDHAYVVPLYTYPNFAAYNANLSGIVVATMQSNYKICQWSWK